MLDFGCWLDWWAGVDSTNIQHPTSNIQLPVHHRPVLGIIALLIPPVMVDLICHGVLIELDAEARAGGQIEIAVVHREGLFQISFTKRDLLLTEEIWNGRGNLDTGRE